MDTSILKRAELLPLLVDAVTRISIHLGMEEKHDGGPGTIWVAELGNMHVMFRTPKAEIATAPSAFGVDVWCVGKGKTFSAIWNSNLMRDFEIISFKRGPWISELLARAASINA